MMYYLIEFNPKDHVTQRHVAKAYRHFVDHYTKIFPQMKLAGLFARDILLGSQPHYFALWEVPDYATLDAWKNAYRGDPDGARLTREINDMGVDWNAKMVQKLLQQGALSPLQGNPEGEAPPYRQVPFDAAARTFLAAYLYRLQRRVPPYLAPAGLRELNTYLDPDSHRSLLDYPDGVVTCADHGHVYHVLLAEVVGRPAVTRRTRCPVTVIALLDGLESKGFFLILRKTLSV